MIMRSQVGRKVLGSPFSLPRKSKSPVCAISLQQTPDVLAWLPGLVFPELYAGDWGGADQRGHLLHLPAQGSATPRSHQGPALARGKYGADTRRVALATPFQGFLFEGLSPSDNSGLTLPPFPSPCSKVLWTYLPTGERRHH